MLVKTLLVTHVHVGCHELSLGAILVCFMFTLGQLIWARFPFSILKVQHYEFTAEVISSGMVFVFFVWRAAHIPTQETD